MTGRRPLTREEADAFISDGKAQCAEAYRTWLDNPMTKVVIGLIPPMPDGMLEQVLRACFEAGFSTGQVVIAMEIAKRIMTERMER